MENEVILLIGCGFAGKRYLRVLEYYRKKYPTSISEIAIVDNDLSKLSIFSKDYKCFSSLYAAAKEIIPTAAIIAVNESSHYEILNQLSNLNVDLILCEKPLVKNSEQMFVLEQSLKSKRISMNMVERFSPIIDIFSDWKLNNPGFEIRRVEFFWGKNRIKDTRPTIGAISEVIHPLDLVKFIFGCQDIEIRNVIATSSDFSINSEDTIDSIDLLANAENYKILGHSSFLWPARHREIIGFVTVDCEAFRVIFNFDNPLWDCDQLKIEKINRSNGEFSTILEAKTHNSDFPEALHQIYKVSEFVRNAFLFKKNDKRAIHKNVDYDIAAELQLLLEEISIKSHSTGSSNTTSLFT